MQMVPVQETSFRNAREPVGVTGMSSDHVEPFQDSARALLPDELPDV
jgi:hypothetical protein